MEIKDVVRELDRKVEEVKEQRMESLGSITTRSGITTPNSMQRSEEKAKRKKKKREVVEAEDVDEEEENNRIIKEGTKKLHVKKDLFEMGFIRPRKGSSLI